MSCPAPYLAGNLRPPLSGLDPPDEEPVDPLLDPVAGAVLAANHPQNEHPLAPGDAVLGQPPFHLGFAFASSPC